MHFFFLFLWENPLSTCLFVFIPPHPLSHSLSLCHSATNLHRCIIVNYFMHLFFFPFLGVFTMDSASSTTGPLLFVSPWRIGCCASKRWLVLQAGMSKVPVCDMIITVSWFFCFRNDWGIELEIFGLCSLMSVLGRGSSEPSASSGWNFRKTDGR